MVPVVLPLGLMLVEAALEALGLSGEPSEAEVRRAYLRRVKEHPPERDPEGFRRVRTAYERLKASFSPEARVTAVRVVAELPMSVLQSPVSARAEPVPQLEPAPSLPSPTASTQPPPIVTLVRFLEFAAQGRFKRARALLETFETHMLTHPEPRGFGVEVGARWKLARELLATSELDASLARAIAQGLRDGQLFSCADALESARRKHGSALEHHMRERAPALWAEVAPILEPPRPARASSRGRSTLGSTGAIVFVLVNVVRILLLHESSATVETSPEPIRPPSTESHVLEPKTADFAPPLPPGERQIVAWASLQQALGVGDCQTVHEQWRPYLALATTARSPVEVEEARKRRILEMCPELRELLEEPP